MIALYIIAAVIGIFALLLWCRVYVTLTYTDGVKDALSVSVRYTLLNLRLVPSKRGKIKLGKYTYKKTHKKKPTKKKAKKADVKEKKPKKTSRKTASEEGEQDEPKKTSVVRLLIEIREIIFDTIKRVPGLLRLEIKRLYLDVGGADAATAAITYGTITQAVGAALTIAEEYADVRIKRNRIMITPDFLSGRVSADVKVRLSVRPGAVAGLGIRFILGFIKVKLTQNS